VTYFFVSIVHGDHSVEVSYFFNLFCYM